MKQKRRNGPGASGDGSDSRPDTLPAMLSRWPAVAAVASVIFVLSHVPPTGLPRIVFVCHADKAVHVVEYAVLGVFLFRSLLYECCGHARTAAIIAVSSGTLFGALDEWHQALSGRVADVWDVLANTFGLVCGTALVLLVAGWRAKNGK